MSEHGTSISALIGHTCSMLPYVGGLVFAEVIPHLASGAEAAAAGGAAALAGSN